MGRSYFSGRSFDAFLFDMDGTLLDSNVVTRRIWSAWGRRHGLDVPAFLTTVHGVRTEETIRRLKLVGVDPQKEAAEIALQEIDDIDGIVAVPGAASLLASLPDERWMIVSSATRPVATRRLEAAGFPVPGRMVTAEDVGSGKPAPDCFLLAADLLGFPIENCLVFEDAVAGIAAAETAGAAVIVVTAAHSHLLPTCHPAITTYNAVKVEINSKGMKLHASSRGKRTSAR